MMSRSKYFPPSENESGVIFKMPISNGFFLIKSEVLPDCFSKPSMILIILLKGESMVERYYPSDEQLFKLYNLLNFLKSGKIYWHKITISGGTIVIRLEPLKGEIDLRIIYISENGEVEEDGFGEYRLL